MAKLTINVGDVPNDRKGDSLRAAFTKINANFTELYTALGLDTGGLNLGAFEFTGSTISTTDSSAITVTQAVTIESDLTVGGDILPSSNVNIDLGSATARFRDLYLSSNTIYLGATTLGVDSQGNLLIGGQAVADVGTAAWANITGKPTFATVSTSGAYADLSGKPTIPTAVSQLTNDSGFVTAADIAGGTLTIDVNNTGDLKGSVFGDDSTLLVDGVNGKIVAPININDNEIFDGAGDTGLNIRSNQTDGNIYLYSYGSDGNGTGAGNIYVKSNAVEIYSDWQNGGAGEKKWTFGGNGSLTFPDATVQTTAWTGSAFDQDLNTTDNPQFNRVGLTAGEINVTAGTGFNLYTTPDGVTSHNLNFSTDGDLTIPGGIKSEGDITFEINLSDSTLRRWRFGEDGSLTLAGPITNLRTDEGKIALGFESGLTNQGVGTVAVGQYSGRLNQSGSGVAVGGLAGNTDQGVSAVAVGALAGGTNQGVAAVAVGALAGGGDQGQGTVAIGQLAGGLRQGEYAIAIGTSAGATDQPANSIVLNASGAQLNGSAAGFYVDPIRNIEGGAFLNYNTSTKELGWSNDISSESDINIEINLSDSTLRRWSFTEGGDLRFPDGTTQSTAFTGGDNGNLNITGTVIEFAAGATEELITIGPDGYAGQAILQLPRNTYVNVYDTILTNSGGNVRIVSGDGVTTYDYRFGSDGNLTLPGNIHSEDAVEIKVNLTDSTTHTWRFGEDGHLNLAGNLTFSDGTVQTTATPTELTPFIRSGVIQSGTSFTAYGITIAMSGSNPYTITAAASLTVGGDSYISSPGYTGGIFTTPQNIFTITGAGQSCTAIISDLNTFAMYRVTVQNMVVNDPAYELTMVAIEQMRSTAYQSGEPI